MTTIVYTALNGFRLLGDELGAWMDTTDSTTDLTGDTKTLTENGALTKSVVNTGASEFQYTGFSATDYLERAYDVDFDLLGDPATDGHTLMAWVNVGTVSTIETIMHRKDTAGLGAAYKFNINDDGTLRGVVTDGTNSHTIISSTDLNNTGWNFIVATWDGVDTQKLYINGELDTSDSGGSAVGSLVNATAVFRIGLDAGDVNPFLQGLTMCKVFAHAVTTQKIKSIYDTEQSIFKINSTYTQYETTIDFTFPVTTITLGGTGVRKVQNSIGGTRQVMFNREDLTWDITSSELYGADVVSFQQMLSALLRGGVFTLDPYDLDETVSCSMDSGSYSPNRIGTSDYFTFSFKMRQI